MSICRVTNKPNHWRIRVVGNCPATGRRKEIDRVVLASNKHEAGKIEIALRDELHASSDAHDRPTVKAYCDSWFVRRRDGEGDQGPLRQGTLIRYAQHLDRFVAALGHRFMDELTPMMIKNWLTEEAKRPGRGDDGKVSGYTLLGMLRVVRTVTRDAQTDLRLPFWPCERVKCPKPLNEYVDDENALAPEDLSRLFDTMRTTEPAYFPLFAVMAFTGLRFCHAHALEWTDLDLDAGTYRIARSRYRGQASAPSKRKSGRHSGALVPELVDVLREHRAKLLREQHPGMAEGLVFPTSIGTHIDHRAVSKAITRAAKAAGITKRFTPHGCRRTLNTIAMQVAPAELVRKVIGHNTAGMTERYLAAGLSDKRRLVEGVARVVRGGAPLALVAPGGDRSGDPAARVS